MTGEVLLIKREPLVHIHIEIEFHQLQPRAQPLFLHTQAPEHNEEILPAPPGRTTFESSQITPSRPYTPVSPLLVRDRLTVRKDIVEDADAQKPRKERRNLFHQNHYRPFRSSYGL